MTNLDCAIKAVREAKQIGTGTCFKKNGEPNCSLGHIAAKCGGPATDKGLLAWFREAFSISAGSIYIENDSARNPDTESRRAAVISLLERSR